MQHPLDSIRDAYLDGFREIVAAVRGELEAVTTELLLEIPSLEYSEYCYRLYRADIVGKKSGEPKIIEVAVDERAVLNIESWLPARARINSPLVWHGIEFKVAGVIPDEVAIVDWASKWMDISDDQYGDNAEFQQVVHSVTAPTVTETGFNVSVDFGSAPTRAFDELLRLLARDCVGVSIGSF